MIFEGQFIIKVNSKVGYVNRYVNYPTYNEMDWNS